MINLKRIGRFTTRNSLKLMPKSMIRYIYKICASHLSSNELEDAIMDNIKTEISQLSSDDALRFLFRIETAIYPLEGQAAVNYGGGIHTKHRHMQYHNFFVDRIKSDEAVLDIGCGIGALAHSIATKTGATVLGIDYDKTNIEKAQEAFQADNIHYELADIFEYTPSQSFDVIVMSNVLEHLKNRVDLLKTIQKQTSAKRFLIRVPRFDRHWSIPLKKELGIEWRLDEDHEIEFTPEIFAQEMQDANLEIIHIEYRWDEIWAMLSVKD